MLINKNEIRKRFNYHEREKVYNVLNEIIEKVSDQDGVKINRIENDMTRTIVNNWNTTATKAINNALTYTSKGNQEKPFTEKDANRVLSILEKYFKGVEKKSASKIKNGMKDIYKINVNNFVNQFELKPEKKLLVFKSLNHDKINNTGYVIRSIEKAKKIKPKYGASDQYIVDNVSRLELIAIGDHYPKNLKPSVSKLIKEGVVKKGLNKAQAGEFLKNSLTKKLGGNLVVPPSVKAQGQNAINAYFKGLSATNVTMNQNFSQVKYMQEAGITRYIWRSIIDKTTSVICQQMDGRVFEIEYAITQMEKTLELDSVEGLKRIAPFRRDLSDFKLKEGQKLEDPKVSQELAKAGVTMPPLHMSCRSMVEPY